MEDQEKVHWLKPASKRSEELTIACPEKQAAVFATMLFACYRAAEASEPAIYMAAAKKILQCYSEDSARSVCDPVNGLPSKLKFLPSIAEIKEACEKANGSWRPPDGTLSPQGYVYDSTKVSGINFLAEPRNRRLFYED